MHLKHLIRGSASAVVLIGLAAGGSAYGQEQDDETVLGEVIVTAQKREQRLQDVPISVTVVGEQLLKDAGVTDIRELSILAPGLTVTATTNESTVTARIRGVGTVGDNPGLESSVGVVIDGVYRPRNGVSFGDLGPTSRIEVLKGPQGTLFGKNTSAGVISIVTREPSFDKGAEIEVTGGDYNARGGSLYLTGPIIADKLAGSLYAGTRSRDGFMDVVTLGAQRGNEDNDQNYWTTRGQLLFLPNDKVTARIIADYTKRNETCCAAVQLAVGQAPTGNRALFVNQVKPGSLDLTGTPFDRVAYANRSYISRVEDYGLSGEVTFDLDNGTTLTSVTAARNWLSENGQDSDFTAADLLYRPDDGTNFTEFTQYSQELRLQGERGKLNWLIGAFAAQEELDSHTHLRYGSDFYAYLDQRVLSNVPALIGLVPGTIHNVGQGSDDRHLQTDRTFAVFTNNDYQLTDALTATLGLRWTSDKKEVTSRYTTTGGSCSQAEAAYPAIAGLAGSALALRVVGGLCVPIMNTDFDALGALQQESQEEEFSGTGKLAYRFNEQVMSYASYSRGYKAGGFNLDREGAACLPGPIPANAHPVCRALAPSASPRFQADPDTSFAPETVDSYELGLKTQLFGNTLLFNATAFHQTFDDFQLNTFAGTQFVVVTLPKVTSKGVDFDFLWRPPVTGLSIQGGGTIADTVIGNYTVADFPSGDDYAPVAHMAGQRLSFAPRYTASLAVTYERPAWWSDRYTLTANISGKYNSEYNTGSDLNSAKTQDSFTVVNARVGIGLADDSVRLELWSMNLFDEDYIQVGFNGVFQVTTNAAAFPGQDPGIVNNPTSVYDAFLGAPRTVGLTLRTKLR